MSLGTLELLEEDHQHIQPLDLGQVSRAQIFFFMIYPVSDTGSLEKLKRQQWQSHQSLKRDMMWKRRKESWLRSRNWSDAATCSTSQVNIRGLKTGGIESALQHLEETDPGFSAENKWLLDAQSSMGHLCYVTLCKAPGASQGWVDRHLGARPRDGALWDIVSQAQGGAALLNSQQRWFLE